MINFNGDTTFSNERGFTLIEVIVSITLMSFLMTYVYQLVNDGKDTKIEVLSEDEVFLDAQRALNRFGTDFSQIYSPLFFTTQAGGPAKSNTPYNSYGAGSNYDSPKEEIKYTPTERFPKVSRDGIPIPALDNPEKGTIIFFTTSNRRKYQDTKESRYAWVKYSFQNNPEPEYSEAPLRWMRNFSAKNPYQGDFIWEEAGEQVVLENIKSFEIEYWDHDEKKYVSSLQELGEKDLIRSVRVTLVWLGPNGGEQEISRSYRVLWPYFDTKEDYRKIQQALNENQNNNRRSRGRENTD